MLKNSIVHADRAAQLSPAPIEPSWVIEGAPFARNAILSRSADSTAFTMLWDCTAGKFEWRYAMDETLYVVEGSVVISGRNMAPRRLEVGDVAFFPVGTTAVWHVETYIRKVAFCRRTLPKPVAMALRLLNAAKRRLGG